MKLANSDPMHSSQLCCKCLGQTKVVDIAPSQAYSPLQIEGA